MTDEDYYTTMCGVLWHCRPPRYLIKCGYHGEAKTVSIFNAWCDKSSTWANICAIWHEDRLAMARVDTEFVYTVVEV